MRLVCMLAIVALLVPIQARAVCGQRQWRILDQQEIKKSNIAHNYRLFASTVGSVAGDTFDASAVYVTTCNTYQQLVYTEAIFSALRMFVYAHPSYVVYVSRSYLRNASRGDVVRMASKHGCLIRIGQAVHSPLVGEPVGEPEQVCMFDQALHRRDAEYARWLALLLSYRLDAEEHAPAGTAGGDSSRLPH